MSNSLINPESLFLSKLFRSLEDAAIRYAVLRNFETLPESTAGSDLDILVHPEDEDKTRVAIANAVRDAGGVVIGVANTVGFFKVCAFGVVEAETLGWWGLRLDISAGMRYGGVADLVDNRVLDSRYCLHKGIRVVSNDLAAILGVAKELLHNDILPVRYQACAASGVENNWKELRDDLAPMGGAATALLAELCLTSPDAPDIAVKSGVLRRAVLRAAFLRAPLTYLRFRVMHQWSKVCRFIDPPGLMVAVLGTDGAGKSTIVDTVEPVLSAATHGAFRVRHLRPGLLPPLARFKGKQLGHTGHVTDPHGANASGKLGSLLRVLYLMADYLLGYWLIVRPIIAKSPTVILFDRYAYDIAFDPRRFRIGLSGKLMRQFVRLAPKPDLVICLHGDPQVIAARKQELPLEEVRRQIAILLEFAENEPRAVAVSTEGTVEQARDDVLMALSAACKRSIRLGSRR